MQLFTKKQWASYLKCLQLPLPIYHNAHSLAALVAAHQRAIPFSLNTALSTQPAAYFTRLVVKKQGGIALQTNLLFYNLLHQLDFAADCFAARLYTPDGLSLRLHPVIKVYTLEGAFLCDVGLPRHGVAIPLRLLERWPQEHRGCCYQFTKSRKYDWILWKKEPQTDWRQLYCFAEDRYTAQDFAPTVTHLRQNPKLLDCYRESPRTR